MIFSSPPQSGQCCKSISNTRSSSLAQSISWVTPNQPSGRTSLWPMLGPPSDEFDATLLTFKTAS